MDLNPSPQQPFAQEPLGPGSHAVGRVQWIVVILDWDWSRELGKVKGRAALLACVLRLSIHGTVGVTGNVGMKIVVSQVECKTHQKETNWWAWLYKVYEQLSTNMHGRVVARQSVDIPQL